MKAAAFDFLSAKDTAHALAVLDAGGGAAKVCSGTQSLGPMLNLRLAQPERLVDVSRLEALRTIELQAHALRIGAAVTHASIEDGTLPDVTRGLLAKVAAGIAYRAVRNRGTLGGSLAHADPSADWVTTMRLLDAGMVVLGLAGERIVPASRFFAAPFTTALADNELLVAVDVPRFSDTARWAYRKSCRKPGEFAEAIVALWIEPARGVARIALGALGGMPHVVEGLDALDAVRRPAGLESLLDGAGVHESYERQLHSALLRRALADLDSFTA